MEQNTREQDNSILVLDGDDPSQVTTTTTTTTTRNNNINHHYNNSDKNHNDDDDDNNNFRRKFSSTPLDTLPENRPQSANDGGGGSTTPNTSTPSEELEEESIATTSQSKHKYSSRLRTASRAIGLFRRAAGTLSRSLTIGQTMNKSASSSGSYHDGCLNQIANDEQQSLRSNNNNNNNNKKRRRSSTFKRFLMRHQSTGDSSQNSQNSSQNCNQATPGGAGVPGLVSFGGADKQQQHIFIVPRMNALKLPLKCLIKSLEGELMREVFVHRYELGQYLIENLKVSLGMNDCKYFGLRLAKSCDDQEDVKNIWLDLNESVCKQIKLNSSSSSKQNHDKTSTTNGDSTSKQLGLSSSSKNDSRTIEFYLRIKFYPPNLTRIQDSFLRNYLWLQLRRDLRLGKLTSSMNNLAQLMACILQYEFGDFKQEHLQQLPEINIMPNQDLVEDAAIELWRTKLANFKPHQALMQFLRAAIILETYGFDYYPVRDHQRQRAYLLGFNYAGIKTIRNGRIVHHFRWHSISKISYERRMIIFHIYPTENSKRKQILGFKCMSNEDCQCLYMRLLEQKYFFTVDLTYFDKSIRRPSCLYSSPNGSSQTQADWTTTNNNNNNSINDLQQQQQQQQQSQNQLGNRPSIIRASGSLDDPPTTSVSSTPDCGGPGSCLYAATCNNDCCPTYQHQQQQQRNHLVRSSTMPSDDPFDNDTMIPVPPSPPPLSVASAQTCQRRAAMAQLHRQQSTSASLSDATRDDANMEQQFNEQQQQQKPTLWAQKTDCTTTHDNSEQNLIHPQEEEEEGRRSGKYFVDQFLSPNLRIFRNTFWSNTNTDSSSNQQNYYHYYLMQILKLLLIILVTNLVLKLTESLSCKLIALLTFPSGDSSSVSDSSIQASCFRQQ